MVYTDTQRNLLPLLTFHKMYPAKRYPPYLQPSSTRLYHSTTVAHSPNTDISSIRSALTDGTDILRYRHPRTRSPGIPFQHCTEVSHNALLRKPATMTIIHPGSSQGLFLPNVFRTLRKF